jgi:DNA adenine methylase
MFFGAGGMYFKKPKAKYNILNDLDNDVYNLWRVLKTKKKELKKELELLPIHQSLWRDYNKSYSLEKDEVLRAVLFLLYSNFGYMGKPETMKLAYQSNTKQVILNKLDVTAAALQNAVFTCADFRKVLSNINYKRNEDKSDVFVYADPPYLSTTNNYQHAWGEADIKDLFEVLVSSDLKFAISEFLNDTVEKLAVDNGLHIIEIGERCNMKNRRTEILITNYKNDNLLFNL